MAHSWINAAAILGLDLVLACPEGYQPNAKIVADAERRMKEVARGSIRLVTDPVEAARDSDVISTDVWASMGQEEEATLRQKAFAGYCVDQSLLDVASAEARILHCLPAHRGEEISAEALEGPQSAVWQQAENRLHAQKAILEAILGCPV
jgi:ornithine carbamoyltransferase